MSSAIDVITVTREDDWWVARDEDSGIAIQESTRSEALSNPDEVVALSKDAQLTDTPASEPDAPWFDSE